MYCSGQKVLRRACKGGNKTKLWYVLGRYDIGGPANNEVNDDISGVASEC